jgi:hypothetical protein
MPEEVSSESLQEDAKPPPGSWQLPEESGVEPGAQQPRPSAVVGPGHIGSAFALSMFAMPAPAMINTAMMMVKAAARTR